MKNPFATVLICALAGLVFGAAAVQGIVTVNPETAGPPANDPHVVDGPVDIRTLAPHSPPRPLIDPDGVVQIQLIEENGTERHCSASVVQTPEGKAILTAAHCATLSNLAQIKAEVPEFGGTPTTYQTCHTDEPACDLDEYVFVHPSYTTGRVIAGYDLALIFFENPIGPFAESYPIADSAPTIATHGTLFVKFGYGCHGYGGDGVDFFDPDAYDDILRWALNAWDSVGLGTYGVSVCSESFNNHATQLVADFDNYTDIQNNLFNYYMQIFDPGNGWIDYSVDTPNIGIYFGEGWSCPGDSGGPNFHYNASQARWEIAAVNSYVFRVNDDFPGFLGNSDVNAGSCSDYNGGSDASFGEYGGDAVVTTEMIDQILGLAVAPAPLPPRRGAPSALPLGPTPFPPSYFSGSPIHGGSS